MKRRKIWSILALAPMTVRENYRHRSKRGLRQMSLCQRRRSR